MAEMMMNIKDPDTLRKRRLALCVFVVFSLLHLAIVVINHANFKTFAYDYGVYNFAFFDFAHFRVSYCPIYLTHDQISFLQDHFSLTLIILSPLYWIFAPLFGTYTLLILQWLFIIGGAWATYRFILLKSGNTWMPLAAMIYYFILYGRFASYESDCNLAIMGSAVIPVFLYFFEKRNLAGLWISFLFLVFNREDFSLGLIFLCLLLAALDEEDTAQRRRAIVLSIASLLFFIFIFNCLIPWVEHPQRKFSLFNYSILGTGPGKAALFMVLHPFETIRLLFVNHTGNSAYDGVKTEFYLVYLISGGFLLFLRPIYLLALVPLVFKKMFNDDPMRWGNAIYQSVEVATLMPVLVFSVLEEVKRPRLKNALAVVICVATLAVSFHYLRLSTSRAFGFNKMDFTSSSFYTSDYNVAEIRRVKKKIPDTAAVCATGRLVPHLAFREHIFHFPYIDEATYVFVCKSGSTFPLSEEEFTGRLNTMLSSNEWQVLEETPELLLLKRK